MAVVRLSVVVPEWTCRHS